MWLVKGRWCWNGRRYGTTPPTAKNFFRCVNLRMRKTMLLMKNLLPLADARYVNTFDYEMSNQQASTSSSVISAQQDSQQDTKVIQRIAELRKAGLWSSTVLPQCVDPPRKKAHWDYFLEEVRWMSTDFVQERRNKRRIAKKLASEAKQVWRRKYEQKAVVKVDNQKEAKRICGLIARMVREFWANADKVVDFKTKEILNARKRKALDEQLDHLVVEADKLTSQMYIDRLGDQTSSGRNSIGDKNDNADYEEEFSDEEKIELEKEAEMDFDDLLSSLPAGFLEKYAKQSASTSEAVHVKDESQNVSEPLRDSIDTNVDSMDTFVDTSYDTEKKVLPSVDASLTKEASTEKRRQELDNIAEAALEFQPTGFTLETTQIKTKFPSYLTEHCESINMWGWTVNGILADEMGLGKTIQTIALLAHLACERTIWGPHLIIVPTSVLLNWEIELKKWCPSFKVLSYFGSAKERAEKRKGWSKDNAFHVCITSYKVVTQDVRAFKKKAWQYMILDEAQNIKNFKSQRWQMLLNIRSRRRLLLTGTPLQNSLMELWSLLHFLMPSVFSSHDDFKLWFNNPMTSMVEGNTEINKGLIGRLHKVLRPFILRRLKSEVEKQMPTKEEKIIPCALSKRQRFLYNEFLSKKASRVQTAKSKDDLRNGKKRRASLMMGVSYPLVGNVGRKNLERQAKRKHLFENSGLEIIRRKRVQESREVGLWLTGRHRLLGAPILPEELISINTKELAGSSNRISFYSCLKQFDNEPSSSTSHVDLFGEACDFISSRISGWVSDTVKRYCMYVDKVRLHDTPIEFSKLNAYDKYLHSLSEQDLRTICGQPDSLADQVELSHLLQFPELRLIEYDCGKLQVLSRLLIQLYENRHRCLIFTQMSKMLDILQSFLSHHNFKYFRLDGSTPIEQRQAMMERFNADESIFVFILSTRSGGIGINLTGADTVIFYDSDWNPTMDAQAQDRCHRIGQTRNVTVYRLISEKTIEENILKKAMQKRRLGEMAIDEAEFTPEFFKIPTTSGTCLAMRMDFLRFWRQYLFPPWKC
uniref:Uncharacterized protein n=1 Tax=Ditylenchus dipsaci TaxID=166011 RepID=A0A915ECT6_9BILA